MTKAPVKAGAFFVGDMPSQSRTSTGYCWRKDLVNNWPRLIIPTRGPTVDFQSFVHLVLAEVGTIPRRALIYIGVLVAISAAYEMLIWAYRPELLPIDYAVTVVLIAASVAVVYVTSMSMIDDVISLRGFVKFLATSVLVIAPMMLSIALLLLSGIYRLGLVPVALLSMAVSYVLIALLPGWPVLQTKNKKIIGPLMALKATKGFRWSLVFSALAIGALNRAIPGASSTSHPWEALAFAAGGGLSALFSTICGLGVAVTASRLMAERLP